MPTKITAVCQQPLLSTTVEAKAKLYSDRMAFAPDDTNDYYNVHLEAKVGDKDQEEQPIFQSNTVSWTIQPSENGSTDLPPVILTSTEPRDAVFVVGSGEKMDVKTIEVFVRSLRSTGCRAEVIMFLDKRCIGDFDFLLAKYGALRLIAIDGESLQKKYHSKKAVVIYRFVLYEHYLRLQPLGRYRKCLHADLFDTYFQRDPFQTIELRGGMAIFAENPKVSMALCRYHRSWFYSCKEAHLLHEYHSIPRVCMGVVMAEYQAFLFFLRLTLFRMLKYCNDQGVLNILLWSGQYAELMPVTVYTARSGPVFHANTEWDFSFSSEGLVLNSDGRAFGIVHQWDRLMRPHPSVTALTMSTRVKLKKRHAYLESFWHQPKQSWDNQRLVPNCGTIMRPGSVVVCIAGARTKHGSKMELFCPTRTAVLNIETEHLTQLQLLHNDTTPEFQPQFVARSPFLSCTSHMIIKKCEGRNWCTVARSEVDTAVRACGHLKPTGDTTVEPADLAASNVLYRCDTR
eukprot:m.47637 g.47637  ORF g.47637 m.47637 type:complete len:514 (+) comp20544_c0_seq1:1769-3310(+)